MSAWLIATALLSAQTAYTKYYYDDVVLYQNATGAEDGVNSNPMTGFDTLVSFGYVAFGIFEIGYVFAFAAHGMKNQPESMMRGAMETAMDALYYCAVCSQVIYLTMLSMYTSNSRIAGPMWSGNFTAQENSLEDDENGLTAFSLAVPSLFFMILAKAASETRNPEGYIQGGMY